MELDGTKRKRTSGDLGQNDTVRHHRARDANSSAESPLPHHSTQPCGPRSSQATPGPPANGVPSERSESRALLVPFVYILRCSDNSFYVGHTDNLTAREKAHNKAPPRQTRPDGAADVEGRILTCSKKGAPKQEDETRRRRNREADEKRPQAARYLLDFGVDARLRRYRGHSHRWRLAGGGPSRAGGASGRSRRRHLVCRPGIRGLNALRGRNAHTRNSISRLRRTYRWRIAPLTRRETNRL